MKFYSFGKIAKVINLDLGLVLFWLFLAGINIGIGMIALSGLGTMNVILGIILLVLSYSKIGAIYQSEIEKETNEAL